MARPPKVQPLAATESPALIERKPGECLGFFQVVSAECFSLDLPKGTTSIIVQAERVPFRWIDGQDPEQYVGMRLAVDVERAFDRNLDQLRFIPQTGSGILNVICYA